MSNDTIKRSDAIKAAEDGMCTFYDCDVLDRLNAAPSADRPQGEWIDIEPRLNRRRVNKYKRCSHCGFSWARPFDDNYCPNCGARMKGAEDER